MKSHNNNKIVIIHGNDGSDVRIGKMCRSLSKMGHAVHFIGWDRRPDEEKAIDLGGAKTHIIQFQTSFGRATLSGQWVFFRHIIKILKDLRPNIVCAVNEDTAFLVLPFKRIFYKRLICDVFDALADRHSNKPFYVRAILKGVSTLSRVGSNRLIATDQERFERFGKYKPKTCVIENVPEDPGEDVGKKYPSGETKIYVAGTLHLGRGLKQIVEVAESAEHIKIVSAGWLYDDYANNVFAKHSKVDYRGIVTAQKSLELAAECDAVLSYYVPTSVNNIYASPNKIYDAMSIGRPVIINSEVKVSEWVREKRVGWLCEYDDINGLGEIVCKLAERRENLPEFLKRTREIFVRGYTWSVMEERLRKLYAD